MAKDTKEKLLETAHSLFELKGFDGVSMREIADKAQVNKGLLHYYFKSKQAVFIGVFKIVSNLIYVDIGEILKRTDCDFDTKIGLMVDAYFNLFSKHPKLPGFMLSEMHKHPDFIKGADLSSMLKEAIDLIEKCIQHEGGNIDEGGFHFLFTMISLCAFPFISLPISRALRPETIHTDLEFLEQRRVYVKKVLIKSYK